MHTLGWWCLKKIFCLIENDYFFKFPKSFFYGVINLIRRVVLSNLFALLIKLEILLRLSSSCYFFK
jgi:hypothetical protein